MKRAILALAALASVSPLATWAQAADGYLTRFGSRGVHAADHASLAHQAQHREAAHHNAHHAPMTGFEHAGVHADLNHQAAHDQAQHHAAHDYGTYGPVNGGRGGGYYGGRSGSYYNNHGIRVQTPLGSMWLHH